MQSSKLLLLLGILLFSSFQAFSQQSKISGHITDTSTGKKLSQAVVSLIRSQDSILTKFTRTNAEGYYEINNIPNGKYVLMVSFPGYAEFVDELDLNGDAVVTRSATIIPRSKLLEEIIIQQKVSAIRIKGDTTEYKADSFKVDANSNVQELLKRLPGLQVNSKGEITAQGQKVEKILVDGEEFFSDDPAVVTQNLRANLVDKVQVFDKKSEQAEFTGVDDGQKTKTINLELKEDKKKGYFGKLEAGSDFDNYRTGKAMINSFKKKQKIAGYITHNNTTFEGLNWNEQRNFGSSGNTNMEIMDDGAMMMWTDGGDDFARGQGLPQSTTAGLSYINKWNKDKNSINGSYQFNDQTVTGRNGSITQTLLPDTSFTNTTTETFNTFRRRNKLNLLYDWNIDSSSSIKVKASGSIVNGQRENIYNGESISEDGRTINEQNRRTTAVTENQDFTSELSYRKRLKKAGRTLSYTGNFSINNKIGDGFLFSDNEFFDGSGQQTSRKIVDQKKTNDERQQTIQNSIIYTEPLSKTWFLELTYKNNFSRNNAERNTLEKSSVNEKYTEIVDTLSNHFLFQTTDHNGGFSFRFNGKKIVSSFGTAVGRTNFKLEDLTTKEMSSIGFTNLLPRASIRFTPKKQKSFTLSYNGNTQNPTLQQINPIIDNIDELNITVGNPNLKQAFRHNFSINMNDYKIIKSRNFYLSGNFSFVNNAITNSNTLDISNGKRTTKTINTNGNYNGSVWTMYGFELFKGVNLNFNSSGTISRFVNEVTTIRSNDTTTTQNVSDNYSIGLGVGLGKWSDKWLNFNFSIEPRYNNSRSSINEGVVTQYWSASAYPYIEMKFKKQKLYFNLDGNFTMYQRTTTFSDNRNVFLINAAVRKTFGKTEAFELKLSVNDLLNQNLGIRRSINSNFISENTFQNIRRFGLLTFTWNFTKNGTPSNF